VVLWHSPQSPLGQQHRHHSGTPAQGSDAAAVRRSATVVSVTDWRHDRIGSALRGENPLVMARMRSGFAVIGDTQHLPGYSLLLTDDVSVDHLTDLDRARLLR